MTHAAAPVAPAAGTPTASNSAEPTCAPAAATHETAWRAGSKANQKANHCRARASEQQRSEQQRRAASGNTAQQGT